MRPLAPVPALVSVPPSLRADRTGHGAVLEYAGTRQRAWGTALAWLDRPVRHDDTMAWLVVVDDTELATVHERVQTAVGDGAVRAAAGPPVTAGEDCVASFAEAHRLLRCGRGAVVGFDDAGLLQALLAVPPQRVAWFVDRHLGPILARPELVETLRVWLAARGSRRVASEQLHLHRNSVGYRVSQLKARLGVDPLDPQHFAVLQAALAAHDLLTAQPR
ncbi:MAG TPA: helix-turn-helix domain-containing protein [Jatrophihabitans sp.]|jgi:sugar diacid utilization regulator